MTVNAAIDYSLQSLVYVEDLTLSGSAAFCEALRAAFPPNDD